MFRIQVGTKQVIFLLFLQIVVQERKTIPKGLYKILPSNTKSLKQIKKGKKEKKQKGERDKEKTQEKWDNNKDKDQYESKYEKQTWP